MNFHKFQSISKYLLLSVLIGLSAGIIVLAWTNPSSNPTSGSGAIGSSEAPANSIYINSDGNVGIGTTSPGGKLDLGSQSTGRRFFTYNAGGANADGLGIDLGGNSYEHSIFFAYGTSDNGRLTI